MFVTHARPTNMSPFAERVYDVLGGYVLSPIMVLKSVCGWRGIDPLGVRPDQLRALIPFFREHVARVTDTENAQELERKLHGLLQ
jgi:hypothetical protein